MQLLIAHGDAATRHALTRVAVGVDGGRLEVIESGDGQEALERLLAADAPALALVDWNLPGIDGRELCRLVCQFHEASPPYIILLAHLGDEIARGLDAGASDCVRAPAYGAELRARIEAGRRIAARLAGCDPRPVTLVAERSAFDDAATDRPRGAMSELRSVLVAE